MRAGEIVGALMTPEGRANPYPLYEAAHKLGSVLVAEEGLVLVHGYAEVNSLLRGNDFGVADETVRGAWDPAFRNRPSVRATASSVLNANAPDHGRMRSLISSAFTPRRVAELEPAIAAATGQMLDELADLGAGGAPVDFMAEFAYRLPVAVICELLGVPAADRSRFRVLATELAATLDLFSETLVLDRADVAAVELDGYFRALVAERRAAPRDDLVSALIEIRDADDGRLSEVELLSNLTLLLIAGFETTTNLFGNGVALLFEHRQVADGLRTGKLGYGGFVDEVLRYDSPVQLTSRIARTDGLSVTGVPIPRGWEALVLIGAANRDPRRYRDPEWFDPARPDINPLSFGAGSHFCLGSVLARLEASTAFPRLLDRFPDLAPAGPPTRNDRLLLRGYQHLPVTVA